MQIEKFISQLLPTFGKDRVVEDIRITRGEMEELAEVYNSAAELLRSIQFKNKLITDKFAMFKRVVGYSGSDNPVVYIDKNIKLIIENLNLCEKLVTDTLNSTIAAKGLTFKQGTIVQFIDTIHFVNRYARKWLHYIYVMESNQYAENPDEALMAISKPDLQWIEENFLEFCNAFKSATMKTEDVIVKLDELPEAEINSTTVRTLTTTMGENKIDPLRLGFAGTWMNPIYFVRMMVAEWQVKRYKAAKEEIIVLKLRKLQLEKQRQGKEDAKLEKEIQYFESRIQSMNYDLEQMEKKYG